MVDIVNLLLDEAFFLAVDISGRNMSKNLKIFALMSEIKHAHAPIIVDINRICDLLIEIYRGSTVDYDLKFADKEIPVFCFDC